MLGLIQNAGAAVCPKWADSIKNCKPGLVLSLTAGAKEAVEKVEILGEKLEMRSSAAKAVLLLRDLCTG
jgi:hypothetical protein